MGLSPCVGDLVIVSNFGSRPSTGNSLVVLLMSFRLRVHPVHKIWTSDSGAKGL